MIDWFFIGVVLLWGLVIMLIAEGGWEFVFGLLLAVSAVTAVGLQDTKPTTITVDGNHTYVCTEFNKGSYTLECDGRIFSYAHHEIKIEVGN